MDNDPSTTENEEDDPIIREIPIIHSKRLHENLYLFQYPLRKKNNEDELKIKKCFFKPNNQEVKLEMEIDTKCDNFDSGKASIIAHQVDGEEKKLFFEDEVVDKVFLTSSKSVKDSKKYAVAAFNGREIHLTCLKEIFQLRPSFPYLDKGLKKKRIAEEEEDDEEAGPSSAQQVTVKFRQNDDRWKKARENSFNSLQQKSNEEDWVQCVWHDSNTSISNAERLKLISENTDSSGQDLDLSNKEYLKLLVPEDQEQAVAEPSLPSNVLSLHALRALPILEQCRLLLKDAQIIQFQQIFMLLAGGKGFTADVLLKTLPKVAVLVRGNWVVKSEVLYPANTFSATSGVPAELMCRARDYVLYLFTVNHYVERKKVSSVMKIPTEEVKEIFTGISKLRHNRGWELVLPTDQEFINKHTELVQKQNAFWAQRFHQLTEFLKDSKEKKQRRKSKSVSEDGKVKGSNHCASSDNDSGTEKNKSPIAARKNKHVKTAERMDVT